MKLTIVSDNRVLAEQFHMKSGSYSSCQLFFPFILLIIIPLSHTVSSVCGFKPPLPWVVCLWVYKVFCLRVLQFSPRLLICPSHMS